MMTSNHSLQNTRSIQHLIGLVLSSSLLLLTACGSVDKSADTTPPQLNLIGDAQITLLQNQTYQDQGATAQDDTDGNISNKIVISGKVDTAVTGNYQLKYNVTDNAGNSAPELTRSISIQENVNSIYEDSFIKVLNLAQLASNASQTPTAYLKDQFQPFVQNSFVQSDRDIFVSYSKTGSTVYSNDNWASKFDFSGVGWDSSKCGVLITKTNILLANHYQRALNSTIIFHAKDGTRVERKIKNTRSLGNYVSGSKIDKRIFDVAVAELNASVPDNIKVYAMLDAGKADGLKEVPAIYTDQTRKAFLEAIKGVYSGDYKNTYRDKNVTDPFIMEAYANDEFTVDYRFMHHNPRGGDSGNPSFLVVNRELVVLSTLTWTEGVSGHYGNSIVGPYLLDIEMINYIKEAIKEMQAE